MRLANIGLMSLPSGRLRSYQVSIGDDGVALPVSFDQGRHVGMGQRPGSWMAVTFRLPEVVDADRLALAWLAVIARHGTLRTVFSTAPSASGGLPAAGRAGLPGSNTNGLPAAGRAGLPGSNISGLPAAGRAGLPGPDESDGPRLHEIEVGPGEWVEHPTGGRLVRDLIREVLDEHCAPFARPSHRLCLLEPDGSDGDDGRPIVIIGADHAHVDAWSLLVLLRDLTRVLDDLAVGRRPGETLPQTHSFARHTAALEAMPPAPPEVVRRWTEILAAGAG